jgi:hypothetical protein
MALTGSINFDYWLDDVMPSVGGAEIEFVLREIRHAAIDFCERTNVWRLEGLTQNVVAGQSEYLLDSPLDRCEIVQVLEVKYDKSVIPVTPQSRLSQNNSNYASLKGIPACYWQDYPEKLNFYPVPNTGLVNGLMYKVSLRPSRVANIINESVGKRYFEAISHGTKARMFAMPKKPWTDPALASYHMQQFDQKISRARDEASTGYGRGAKRVVSHY